MRVLGDVVAVVDDGDDDYHAFDAPDEEDKNEDGKNEDKEE